MGMMLKQKKEMIKNGKNGYKKWINILLILLISILVLTGKLYIRIVVPMNCCSGT